MKAFVLELTVTLLLPCYFFLKIWITVWPCKLVGNLVRQLTYQTPFVFKSPLAN